MRADLDPYGYPLDPANIKESNDLRVYGDSSWQVNNSAFSGYHSQVTFDHPYTDVPTILEQQNIRDDTGIDIAGGTNGQALRDLLDSGVLQRALVTNFEDLRTPEVRADARLDHQAGSLLHPQTWKAIRAWQQANAPDGVGLVFHRPFAALQHLPPTMYRWGVRQVINMLRPGGVFFTQIPNGILGLPHGSPAPDDVFRLINRPDVARVLMSHRREHRDLFAVIIKASTNQS